jgi:hypothetical protein
MMILLVCSSYEEKRDSKQIVRDDMLGLEVTVSPTSDVKDEDDALCLSGLAVTVDDPTHQ